MKVISSFLVSSLLFLTTTFAQSPYKTSWEKDGIILGSNLAVAFLGSSLENKTTPLSVQEIDALSRNKVNAFDRSATYNWSKNISSVSDVCVIMTALSPVSLFLDKEIREDFQTVSTMYLETMLLAAFLPSIAKGSAERIRPFVYNENAPLNDKLDVEAKKSFFSGHTTVAFASAVFLSTVYEGCFPDSKYKNYVWAGSLFTASLTGFLRYESGAHFPTDVLIGAVVGSAVGYLIPYLHNTNSSESDVYPSINNTNGITLHYVFQF